MFKNHEHFLSENSRSSVYFYSNFCPFSVRTVSHGSSLWSSSIPRKEKGEKRVLKDNVLAKILYQFIIVASSL